MSERTVDREKETKDCARQWVQKKSTLPLRPIPILFISFLSSELTQMTFLLLYCSNLEPLSAGCYCRSCSVFGITRRVCIFHLWPYISNMHHTLIVFNHKRVHHAFSADSIVSPFSAVSVRFCLVFFPFSTLWVVFLPHELFVLCAYLH